jgi:hypothetical protein
MPILYGAVAYQSGEDQFAPEIQSWDLAKHTALIRCPVGCLIQYDLYVEINASEDRVKEYTALVHEQLKNECPYHPDRIRINPEG